MNTLKLFLFYTRAYFTIHRTLFCVCLIFFTYKRSGYGLTKDLESKGAARPSHGEAARGAAGANDATAGAASGEGSHGDAANNGAGTAAASGAGANNGLGTASGVAIA